MTQAESCRPPPYSPMHVDLSPILLGGEGDLASPLLPASAPIDLASLNPELLKEVQHVVIAREDLLLHVHEIIGRGGTILIYTVNQLLERIIFLIVFFYMCFKAIRALTYVRVSF